MLTPERNPTAQAATVQATTQFQSVAIAESSLQLATIAETLRLQQTSHTTRSHTTRSHTPGATPIAFQKHPYLSDRPSIAFIPVVPDTW